MRNTFIIAYHLILQIEDEEQLNLFDCKAAPHLRASFSAPLVNLRKSIESDLQSKLSLSGLPKDIAIRSGEIHMPRISSEKTETPIYNNFTIAVTDQELATMIKLIYS